MNHAHRVMHRVRRATPVAMPASSTPASPMPAAMGPPITPDPPHSQRPDPLPLPAGAGGAAAQSMRERYTGAASTASTASTASASQSLRERHMGESSSASGDASASSAPSAPRLPMPPRYNHHTGNETKDRAMKAKIQFRINTHCAPRFRTRHLSFSAKPCTVAITSTWTAGSSDTSRTI